LLLEPRVSIRVRHGRALLNPLGGFDTRPARPGATQPAVRFRYASGTAGRYSTRWAVSLRTMDA